MKKKHPQIFTQATSVQNFSQIEPFLKPPACPKVLRQTDRYTDRQTLSDSSSTEVEKKPNMTYFASFGQLRI